MPEFSILSAASVHLAPDMTSVHLTPDMTKVLRCIWTRNILDQSCSILWIADANWAKHLSRKHLPTRFDNVCKNIFMFEKRNMCC